MNTDVRQVNADAGQVDTDAVEIISTNRDNQYELR